MVAGIISPRPSPPLSGRPRARVRRLSYVLIHATLQALNVIKRKMIRFWKYFPQRMFYAPNRVQLDQKAMKYRFA